MEIKHLFKFIALGDSITTGFNAERAADNHSFSWSTGYASDFPSHLARLKQVLPSVKVETKNVAQSGARSASLSDQIRSLGPMVAADYATILIGANDLTDMLFMGEYGEGVKKLRDNVERAIVQLTTTNPRIMITMSAIPNQALVVDTLVKNPRFNPSLLNQLKSAYKERHTRANAALTDIALKYRRQVRYAVQIGTTRFNVEHLSALDRYHPNTKGQALLAELTWQAGWFP